MNEMARQGKRTLAEPPLPTQAGRTQIILVLHDRHCINYEKVSAVCARTGLSRAWIKRLAQNHTIRRAFKLGGDWCIPTDWKPESKDGVS